MQVMERHYNFYLSASLEATLFFACVRAGARRRVADGARGEGRRIKEDRRKGEG